jgi:tetratricopeptide (TPR) repeat protein
MNKSQWSVVGGSVIIFILFYFVFDTKTTSQKAVESVRSLAMESTNLESMLMDSKDEFTIAQMSAVIALERQLSLLETESDTLELIATYKQLAGEWYKLGKPAISGAYALKVAQMENLEESWSIAGTTLSLCLQRETEEKVVSYCTEKAIEAFETAISLNPDNLSNRINLVLTYTENPPKENPMKGITMLLDLNERYPEQPLVLNTLASLAIKTSQYERALERLNRSFEIDPENNKTICMLALVNNQLGRKEDFERFSQLCNEMNK